MHSQVKENIARELYLKISILKHDDLTVSGSGLVINPQWPFIGASPDDVIECKCCGKGVLQIKCTYPHRQDSVDSAALNNDTFCLKIHDSDSALHLDHSHAYYYQVQTQMFVCNVNYCDFCVCTFPLEKSSPHIERILRNDDFWRECLTEAETFFTTCLLPELMGNWYTRPSVKSSNTSDFDENTDVIDASGSQKLYCYCSGPDEGSMIACNNTECKIEWFHQDCLNLKSVPRGKWYCPDCSKLPEFLGKGKGKKKDESS